MALTKGKLGTWLCALVVSEPPCSRILLHVGLEEHRWSRRAWHVSHTLTGLGEAGSGSSLSEQLLQKISPQLRQWCCGERRRHVREVLRRRVYGSVSAESARALTFRLEMENSFSHSLQWLASLSFNQTWPPWNKEYLFCQVFFFTFYMTRKTTNNMRLILDGRIEAARQYSPKLIYQHLAVTLPVGLYLPLWCPQSSFWIWGQKINKC